MLTAFQYTSLNNSAILNLFDSVILNLFQDNMAAHRSCLDKLSTNGLWNNIVGAAV